MNNQREMKPSKGPSSLDYFSLDPMKKMINAIANKIKLMLVLHQHHKFRYLTRPFKPSDDLPATPEVSRKSRSWLFEPRWR